MSSSHQYCRDSLGRSALVRALRCAPREARSYAASLSTIEELRAVLAEAAAPCPSPWHSSERREGRECTEQVPHEQLLNSCSKLAAPLLTL